VAVLVIQMLVVQVLTDQTQFLHQLLQLEAVAVVLHPTVELIQERLAVQAVVLTMLVMAVLEQLTKAMLVVLERLSLILAVAGEQVVLEEMLVRLQAKVEQVV
tara:strand:+ start:224 stop:532 length:309 start_codon:yes stop_codon:yes gene_type:complete